MIRCGRFDCFQDAATRVRRLQRTRPHRVSSFAVFMSPQAPDWGRARSSPRMRPGEQCKRAYACLKRYGRHLQIVRGEPGGHKTRPLYGVCQGGRNGPANSSCFLPCFLASFLACFFVRRDVSSSRRHFLPYFASSTESVGRFCPEAWPARSRS